MEPQLFRCVRLPNAKQCSAPDCTNRCSRYHLPLTSAASPSQNAKQCSVCSNWYCGYHIFIVRANNKNQEGKFRRQHIYKCSNCVGIPTSSLRSKESGGTHKYFNKKLASQSRRGVVVYGPTQCYQVGVAS